MSSFEIYSCIQVAIATFPSIAKVCDKGLCQKVAIRTKFGSASYCHCQVISKR